MTTQERISIFSDISTIIDRIFYPGTKNIAVIYNDKISLKSFMLIPILYKTFLIWVTTVIVSDFN